MYIIRTHNCKSDLFKTISLEKAFNIMVRERQRIGHKGVYVHKLSQPQMVVYQCRRCETRKAITPGRCNCCCYRCGMGFVGPVVIRKRIKDFRGLRLSEETDVNVLMKLYGDYKPIPPFVSGTTIVIGVVSKNKYSRSVGFIQSTF